MIVKKVENPRKSASKAVRIEALASYIRAPETTSGNEKCAYYGARGFLTDDPAVQTLEMIELAEAAPRSPDPVTHYVLSYAEGERPTPEQIEVAVDIFLEECGRRRGRGRALHDWTCHQVMYALHSDTGHYHVHLVINRVDPQTERAVKIDGGWDVEVGHRAGVRIEEQQGWHREDNKRYRLGEDGELVRLRPNATALPRQPTQRQIDAERRTGEPSAARVAIERAGPVIKRAETWTDMHTGLQPLAMRYERRGSGAVVIVGDVPIKASRVARGASLRALEARLGPFEPAAPERPGPARAEDAADVIAAAKSWTELHESLAPEGFGYEQKGSGAVVRAGDLVWRASEVSRHASLAALERRLGPYEPAPGTPGARDARPSGAEPDLWEEYWTAHATYAAELARKRRETDDERDRELEALREAYSQERAAIAARDWRHRGEHLNFVRATLAHLHREERKAARARHREAMAAIRAEHPRWPSFPAWLAQRAEGRGEAPARLVPRDERRLGPPTPRRLEGYRSRRVERRVEYLDRRDEVAFIDRGHEIDVRHDHEEAAVLAALRLAVAQWGTVRANGSLRYRELCARLAKEHELDVMTGLEAAAEHPHRPEATRYTPASTPERVPDPHPPEVVAPPGDIRGYEARVREPPRDRDVELETASTPAPPTPRVAEELHDVFAASEGAVPQEVRDFADTYRQGYVGHEPPKVSVLYLDETWDGNPETRVQVALDSGDERIVEKWTTVQHLVQSLSLAKSGDPLDSDGAEFAAFKDAFTKAQIELEHHRRIVEELEAAQDEEDERKRRAAYGAAAVRLADEFHRLREEHGELRVNFHVDDQPSTGTLRFIDRDGIVRHASRESPTALAEMQALVTRRPPEDIPELEREITQAIAVERARSHERGR